MASAPRSERSGVWQFFKRLPSDKAECQLCPQDSTRRRVFKLTKRSTSGLHTHLKAFHQLEYATVTEKKSLTGKRSRQCAEFLAEHASVSPSIFHSKTFLAFFPENEWTTFPSRTTLTDTVMPEMVREIKERNKKDLTGVPVTLVTDGWTSKGSKVSLTVVLAYFVTKDWKVEGRLLVVRKTSGRHTADAIRDLLQQVINEHDLTVTAIVSDSAANVRKAVRDMGFRNPRCMSHQLHIMVTRGLDAWRGGAAIKKVKEFARSINTSAPIRDTYFKACEQAKLRSITVPNSIVTRWGSEYKMINAALQQIAAVNKTLVDQGKRKISDNEIHCLQQTSKVLAPFDRFTLELSREGNIISESLFVLQGVKQHLENIISTETGSTLNLAQHIMTDLNKKWGNFFEDEDILKSAFFDPSAIFNFKTEVNWKEIAETFQDDAEAVAVPVHPSLPTTTMSSRRAAIYGQVQQYPSINPSNSSAPPAKKSKGNPIVHSLEAESAIYIDQCINGTDVNYEALDFWRLNHFKFPRLSVLAGEYLSAPPTSISAERVFSAAGLIFRNHLKNRLSAEHAEEILLLRLNYFGNLRAVSHKSECVIVAEKNFHEEEEVLDELDEEEERDMDCEIEEDEEDCTRQSEPNGDEVQEEED